MASSGRRTLACSSSMHLSLHAQLLTACATPVILPSLTGSPSHPSKTRRKEADGGASISLPAHCTPLASQHSEACYLLPAEKQHLLEDRTSLMPSCLPTSFWPWGTSLHRTAHETLFFQPPLSSGGGRRLAGGSSWKGHALHVCPACTHAAVCMPCAFPLPLFPKHVYLIVHVPLPSGKQQLLCGCHAFAVWQQAWAGSLACLCPSSSHICIQ